jgi:LmbE family N-acetylglucosaminyl deacetylase
MVIVHVTDGAPRDTHAQISPRDYPYAELRRAEAARALCHAGIDAAQVIRLHLVDQEVGDTLAPLAAELAELLREHRPDVVVTHPFEGGHPDHDACAFAVARSVEGAAVPPRRLEWTSYHDDGHGDLETGAFLPHPDAGPEVVCPLSASERERKVAMIAEHASQAGILRRFGVREERFRVAPRYDFLVRPQPLLLYERHDWKMSWPRWCALVSAAVA